MSPAARSPKAVVPTHLEAWWKPDDSEHPLSGPARRLLIALSCATTILKVAKVAAWSDLTQLPAAVLVTAEQRDALEQSGAALSYLRVAVGTTRAAAGADDDDERSGGSRSVVVCGRCGRWQVIAGAVQAGCALTGGCSGVLFKAQPAVRYTAKDRSVTVAA